MDKRSYKKLKVGNGHFRVYKDNRMKWFGDTDLDKKVIRLNIKRSKKSGKLGEVLDTVQHELLHAKHPKAKERTIQKMTKQSIKHMSKMQKAKIYAKIPKRSHH